MNINCRTFELMNIVKTLGWISTLVVVISISLGSCENELDLVAPYEEIGVIYGLINPTDSVHIVRIQKAFLGEGNALLMAQNPDSIYYLDILTAKLQRIKNGAVLEELPLSRYIGDPLNQGSGTFPTTPNILYKTNSAKIYRDSDYRIIVTNNETGYEMRATTPIIDSLIISRPTMDPTVAIPWAGQFPITVEYTTGKDGKVFNLTIRFKYTEETIANGVIVDKYVDWVFPNKLVKDPDMPEIISLEVDGEDFYRFLGDAIKVDASVRRYAGTTDFIITSGAEFLADYININSATTSILTTIPEYTNIENGTGIFSCRYTQVTPNKPLDANSLNYLKTGPYTSDLGFQ